MPHAGNITYSPTWVEWSILAGCFAAFVLSYMLFMKLFPIVSIWELREGHEKSSAEVTAQVESSLPALDQPKMRTKPAGATA